jgi:hypothetical protein
MPSASLSAVAFLASIARIGPGRTLIVADGESAARS